MEQEKQLDACTGNVLAKFQSLSELTFQLKKEQKIEGKSMLMYRDVLPVLPTGYGKSLIFQAYVMAREQLNKQRHKRLHPGDFPAYQQTIEDQIVEVRSLGIKCVFYGMKWWRLLHLSPHLRTVLQGQH